MLRKYPVKTVDFELARFFLALHKATEVPQLLPYMKKQIFDNTEKFYTSLTDEEVQNWLTQAQVQAQK